MNIPHPAAKHPYITTLTGVNIGHPHFVQPGDIRMVDVARALAMTCRYRGHLDEFYSVAEHSVHVSFIAESFRDYEAEIPALLHDAHEAYTGDLPSPHKDMVAGWREFEADFEDVVRRALCPDFPPQHPVWQRVKKYDTMILHREIGVLRSVLPDWYNHNIDAQVPEFIQPIGLGWRDAQSFFRCRLEDLQA